MANKLFKTVLGLAAITMISMAASPALAISYWEEMDTIDAQIELINKRNELGNALKNGSSTLSLPSIVSIIEDNQGKTAKLIFDNGLVRWVSVGDELMGGLVVQSISTAGVKVRAKKSERWLPFQTAASDEPSSGTSGNSVTIAADAPLMRLPPMEPRRISTPPTPSPAPASMPAAPTAPAN